MTNQKTFRNGQILATAIVIMAISVPAFAVPKKAKKIQTSNSSSSVTSTQSSAVIDDHEYRSGVISSGKLDIEPSLGMAFIDPRDVNRVIRQVNDNAQKAEMKGFSLSEIGSTPTYGVTVIYRATDLFGLGLGFNRLSATSESSTSINDQTLNGTIGMGATLLTVESRFMLYRGNRIEVVAGPRVGLGVYQGREEFNGSLLPRNTMLEAGSTGLVYGAVSGFRYWFTENLAGAVNLGYRQANSGTLKIKAEQNSGKAVNSELEHDGKKVAVDASGFELATSIMFNL